jgi:hypothetical protein
MEKLCIYWGRFAPRTVAHKALFVSHVYLVYSVCLVVDQDQKDEMDQID